MLQPRNGHRLKVSKTNTYFWPKKLEEKTKLCSSVAIKENFDSTCPDKRMRIIFVLPSNINNSTVIIAILANFGVHFTIISLELGGVYRYAGQQSRIMLDGEVRNILKISFGKKFRPNKFIYVLPNLAATWSSFIFCLHRPFPDNRLVFQPYGSTSPLCFDCSNCNIALLGWSESLCPLRFL